ncbi:MAG: hypothetical protein ACREN5_04335 [Gemmatimonadales bacterium]
MHGRWDSPGTVDEPAVDLFDDDGLLAMLPMFARDEPILAVGRASGGCREFVEDGEGGRGTCLHPASGVLSPWTDTAACPYWSRR